MYMHIGDTWQIRLNGCAMSASATRGGKAACFEITLGNVVIFIPTERYILLISQFWPTQSCFDNAMPLVGLHSVADN